MARPFPVPPLQAEGIIGKSFENNLEPARIVVIRLHAFGDTAITLPALAALRRRLPGCRLEMVTDVRSAPLFAARLEVDRVWSFDTRAPLGARGVQVAGLARTLRGEPLDAVIDLQRSRWSRALTALLAPRAWVGFDRFAPRSALTRYLEAVAWIGLGVLEPVYEASLRSDVVTRARKLLRSVGVQEDERLVCLNPAGGWPSKQWPLERYVALGRRLSEAHGCRILLLGAGQALPRLEALREALGPGVVDLIGRTTPDLALGGVAEAAMMVSDDSGLMHLAWTQGVPTLALFGSTRWTWSRPEGPHSTGFYSEDLPCGACMQPDCARQDLLCLDRVTVDDVLEKARAVLAAESSPADA